MNLKFYIEYKLKYFTSFVYIYVHTNIVMKKLFILMTVKQLNRTTLS